MVLHAAAATVPVMVSALKGLYDVTIDINEFIDDHIEKMKEKENPTIARTGKVLEGAKYGFGIGYLSPVIVIGAGQLLLGNTMAAIGTAATAATLTNPIAMTCAAVGAVYFGWKALSDQERNEIIEKLCKGFEVGAELVKAIIRFVLETSKEIFSSKNIAEIKDYISSAAEVFGKTLGDVTKKISDKVSDTFNEITGKASETIDKTVDMTQQAYDAVKDTTEKAASGTKETFNKMMKNSKSKEGE